MRSLLKLFAITLMSTIPTIASAQATLDIDGNLPAAADGSTTTLADGTTLTLTEFVSGLGSIFPNSSTSDFDFASSQDNGAGAYSYLVLDVTFGTDFGVSGDGLVSAQDFELGVSSLNGASNWYEFGFLDLKGTGGTITPGAVDTYLADTTNYTDSMSFVPIGTALGANVANDTLNNGGADGSSGSGPSNDTWDNTDFGLAPDTAISGFTFFYGAVTSDDRQSSPGASIGDFEDAMTLQAAAVPEPSALALLLTATCFTGLRRRR